MSDSPATTDPSDSAKLPTPKAETVSFEQEISKESTAVEARPTPPPAPTLQVPDATPAGPFPNPMDSAILPRSLVGQTLGDLLLIDELGRGGMGIVYKARQLSLDRIVAVKLLSSDLAADPTSLARFQTESRAAASLSHPHIVQVFHVGECAAGNYMAMEYIDGESLEKWISKGKISVSSAVAVMIPISEAVHFAHTRGVIHRDLKPANLMLDRNNRPVVMDFGIAKFLNRASNLTQQGVLIGTPAFMSPEQASDSSGQVGPRSDVYSLGAILYTLLTGQVPYDEGSTLRTILRVIGPEMPPSIRGLRPRVPVEVERICMKCLQKKPEDRYQTAQALADELRRFLNEHLVSKDKEKGVTSGTYVRQKVTLPGVALVAIKSGQQIRITRPKMVIGRISECDIVLKAADISKQHCQIILLPDQVVVEDLGSANGTFVNGESITKVQLVDRDRLRIAEHEFLVRIAMPTPPGEKSKHPQT